MTSPADSHPSARLAGSLMAVAGVLGFSFKAVLVKLAYAAHPVDPVTLLALRMLYALPLFAGMAFVAERARDARPMTRHDVLTLAWLGFVGYYLASYLDFAGLQYVSASLERLVLFLYPTIVVLLSALFLRQRITRRVLIALALSYAGIALVFLHDLRNADRGRDVALGGALVFGSAFCYAAYLVGAGPAIARLGSRRFIAWVLLASTVFVLAQFLLMRPLAALAVPWTVHALAIAMAVLSTFVPVWLVAEALKRIDANTVALVGSLGPVFTIGFGHALLDEPLHAIQFAGVALVLAGVLLVSYRRPPARATPPRGQR
jgi:drug/metabolite transporter (DMT)-like permease